MIPRNLRDKCITLMKKNLEIYEAYYHKTMLHQFGISTDDPVERMKRLECTTYFQTLGFENVNGCFSTGIFLIGSARLIK